MANDTRQMPAQRWLVLTEFGVELQPTGCYPIADQMLRAIRPYRQRASLVTEAAYKRAYDDD